MPFFYNTEIIIGFEEETYTFTEQNSGTDNVMGSGSRVDLGSGLGSGVDTGSIESVCVEVSGGTLGRDVTVNVVWTPGTATRTYVCMYVLVWGDGGEGEGGDGEEREWGTCGEIWNRRDRRREAIV